MEVVIQTCKACGGIHLKNILYRVAGEPDRVMVQCQNCQAFVASYVLATMGYYHHGKGYESFVRSCHRGGEFLSARRIQDIFKERTEKEEALFKEVTAYLTKQASQKE